MATRRTDIEPKGEKAPYKADYRFENPYETINIEGFEIPVVLPKKPAKKDFRNWGKKKKYQRFKKEKLPRDIKKWSEKRRDKFVSKMYHKRKHGEWWLIKGNEVYITGRHWMFLNFWWCQAGKLPDFKSGDLDFFLVWEHCFRDKNCFGLLDIKGRRMGDTEKAVFLLWEAASITRNAWCGMQNIKEEFAKANFQRVVKGQNKMPFYFKPIMRGSSNPSKAIEFNYPEEIYSRQKLKKAKEQGEVGGQGELVHKYPAIDSRIDYESSVLGRYDGVRLLIYHLDEPGKIEAFDVNKQWDIIKPALALYNGETIVGKSLWTTTVEDFKNGETMKSIKKTWDESDPNNLDKNGQTKSGLYRYFRNCTNAYKTDEFGYHKTDECIERRNNNIEAYTEVSDWDGLAGFLRRFPMTVSEVFTPPHKDCVLYPVLLDKRLQQIEQNIAGNGGSVNPDGSRVTPRAVKGDFVWSKGFGSAVQWLPNPNGRWEVSQLPAKPNNVIYKEDGYPAPANAAFYTFGVDPVDHMANKGQGSDLGGTVYRRFDRSVDGHLDMDDKGIVCEYDVWRMQTGQFIADYLYRTADPTGSFEDLLKAAIYYGVPHFPEKDRPSIIQWFYGKKMHHYIQYRPKATRVESVGKKKYGKTPSEKGIKASSPVIDLYVQELKKHVYHHIFACHHPRIIKDWRLFNVENRTFRDLTVATGMSLLGDMDQKEPDAKEEKDNGWKDGMPTQKRRHTF